MKTVGILRLSGLCCILGGTGLVTLFGSRGGCIGDDCDLRPLPGTGAQAPWGVVTVVFLVAAAVGLFAGAGRRMPVHRAAIAAALCAAGGALFAVAAEITAERTGGETWLMPVFVFPALLLLASAGVVIGAITLQAALLPPRIATAWIVAALLMPLLNSQSPLNFIPALQGLVCAVAGLHLLVRGGQSTRHLDQQLQQATE